MNPAILLAAASPSGRLRERLHAAASAVRGLGEADLADPGGTVARLRDSFAIRAPAVRIGEVEIVGQRDYATSVADWPVTWRRVTRQRRDYRVAVPFDGDHHLVRAALTTCVNTPTWTVHDHELTATFTVDPGMPGTDVRQAIDDRVADAAGHVGSIQAEVDRYHDDLGVVLTGLVEQMAAVYTAGLRQRDQIGLPIRPTEPVPVAAAAGATGPSTVVEADVDEVLDHRFDAVMGAVEAAGDVLPIDQTMIELMNEQHLRSLLVVYLKGCLVGFTITAEEFRGRGKTDIIVRWSTVVVAVIECKIWRGPGEFTAGLDQLLSYLTPADSRSGYLVFIRDQGVSAIETRARQLTLAHSNCVDQQQPPGVRRVEYRFHATGDAHRPMRLVLLTLPLTTSATGSSRDRGLGRTRRSARARARKP